MKVKTVFLCDVDMKFDKVTAHAIRGAKSEVTSCVFLSLLTVVTFCHIFGANIAQKNGFYYHNLDFGFSK